MVIGIEQASERGRQGFGSSIIYGIALSDSVNGEVLVSFEPQTNTEEPELPDDSPDWEWEPIEMDSVSEDDPDDEYVYETYDEGGA